MQIAIDTSTAYAGLALVQGSRIIAEINWQCGSNHSLELTPRLQELLSRSNCAVEQIEAVFVARGPGSFNGLRVGVSTAKGIAYGLGIPIVGISTLEATAYTYGFTALPVCAIQNAGREEIAAAVFQQKPRKGWTRLIEEQIITPARLVELVRQPVIFCGEISENTTREIKKKIKKGAFFTSGAGQMRRAAYLAELGRQRLDAGDGDNAATLQPLYLRRPPITERKKPF